MSHSRSCSTRIALVLGISVVILSGGAGIAAAAAPRPALSTTPSPGNWEIPPMIALVGHDANGVADPRGEFLIAVRDLANNPMPNSVVTIDLSACVEARLCSDPHDPAAIVNCGLRSVSKVTDINGEVRFRLVGCSVGTPGQPGADYNCARVYADGMFGGAPSVAIYDLGGCDGVDSSDLSNWVADFFLTSGVPRGDYDGSHDVSANDLAGWLAAFFAADSRFNCGNAGRCGP